MPYVKIDRDESCVAGIGVSDAFRSTECNMVLLPTKMQHCKGSARLTVPRASLLLYVYTKITIVIVNVVISS